ALDRIGDTPGESGAPDWAYWIDDAQANAQAGYCYLTLRDWPKARVHLRNALAAQADACSREGALRQILLATTFARQSSPELERATALGHQALETLRTDVRPARCEQHLGALAGQLRSYSRNPAAREFVAQVDQVLRRSRRGSRPPRNQ
ncbi:MAG: hypothetical protein ACRDPW_02830, partial [Mycobacteriales bacterium]